jgi:hypothetical protein
LDGYDATLYLDLLERAVAEVMMPLEGASLRQRGKGKKAK